MESDGQTTRCSSAAAGHSRLDDGGFVLVALLIGIAVASVWMTAALPSWRQQVIRQREDDLIFRGEQYARALRLYQAQNGSLPTSLDDLVSQHFLRRKYKDPITNDEFLPRVGCQQFGPGNPGIGLPPGRGTPGGGTVTPGGGAPIGPARGGRLSQSGFPPVFMEMAQAPGRGTNPGPAPGRGQVPTQPGRGQVPGQMPGQFPGQIPGQGQVGQGGICGVQSKSTATSIRIYNGQQQYDLWQFDTTTAAVKYQQTLVRLGAGIQPGQGMPGMPGSPGGQRQGGVGPGGTAGPGGRTGTGPGRGTGPGTVPGRGVGPGGGTPTFPGGGQPGVPPNFPGGRRG